MKNKNWLKTLIVVFALFVLWVIVSETGIFSSYVFPGPSKVWKTFLKMLMNGELVKNTAASLIRVAIGFIISFVLAFFMGILACLFQKAAPYYRPILEFIRHIPPMSLIPLLILWFGIGETPKTIIIVLTAFFPIFMNTESGLNECDKKWLEVGETLHMNAVQKFLYIRLPAAFPSILVGVQLGLGYSWRAIVGAEMIAAASGIGYMILDAQAMSRSDKVLVGIILIGALGLVTDVIFDLLIKKITERRKTGHASQ